MDAIWIVWGKKDRAGSRKWDPIGNRLLPRRLLSAVPEAFI